MCCCHCQNRCCRRGCCSGSGNGGAVTLPALDQLMLANSGGDAAARWPVYVSVPAFLWENEEENSGSCSCCGCCRG